MNLYFRKKRLRQKLSENTKDHSVIQVLMQKPDLIYITGTSIGGLR